MLLIAAWFLVVLGVAHLIYGAVRFNAPLKQAFAEGFIGKFMASDTRRLAFWFILAGPLMAMAGHVALRAISIGDYGLVNIIGYYLFAVSLPGVLAFPKSPMWAGLLIAPVLILAGAA